MYTQDNFLTCIDHDKLYAVFISNYNFDVRRMVSAGQGIPRKYEDCKGSVTFRKRLDRPLYTTPSQTTHMCIVDFDMSNRCFQSATGNALSCKHLPLAWVLAIEALKHTSVYSIWM